jgi:hypothetical protein
MTPVLSAACYLPATLRAEFIEDVREHVLEGGRGRAPRRFNVLANPISAGETPIRDDTCALFSWPPTAGEVGQRFVPGKDLGLVFNSWAVLALLSFIIEREDRWTKGDLSRFGESFLAKLVRRARGRLGPDISFPATPPKNDIPQLGLLFRVFTYAPEADVRDLLTACVREQREESRAIDISDNELDWVLGTLHSLVPLPHNEVYQTYHESKNPVGKWQDSFVRGADPENLIECTTGPLLWQHAGRAIAAKLL